MGLPCVVALNMVDVAARRGIHVDAEALARELAIPVVSTVGVKADGDANLRAQLEQLGSLQSSAMNSSVTSEADQESIDSDHETVQKILIKLKLNTIMPDMMSDRIDRIVLHPLLGPLILTVLLFLIFQAMFSLANVPMEAIKSATEWLGEAITDVLPEGWVRSLIVNGLIAGAGSVIVFLPQILILFFFILLLEESGYLPRAAFLLDRIMGSVGLSGRSFIPLLSSFACAVPGIMATRTIANPRDRIVTMLIAPLMTCSARLPIYALLISAFIPQRLVWGGIELQGLVLFGLYVFGVVGAMAVALVLKHFTSDGRQVRPLMMELPSYHLPTVRNLAIGLWQRVEIFLRRVGSIILILSVGLWLLASFPGAPPGATGQAIEYSIVGIIGHALAVVFAPIGFNWQISVALVPGMAAREVAVSALGTVYALSATGNDTSGALAPLISQSWSLATALSLLAWYVFAPQCLSTLAAVKRETGNWKMPLVIAGYLFGLAYLASFITYRIAVSLGGG